MILEKGDKVRVISAPNNMRHEMFLNKVGIIVHEFTHDYNKFYRVDFGRIDEFDDGHCSYLANELEKIDDTGKR